MELEGLQPGREYFYRLRRQRHLSPVGRTLTAPSGARSPLRIAAASCQSLTGGYCTAHRRMAEDAPDVVLFLGDKIYNHISNGGLDGENRMGNAAPAGSDAKTHANLGPTDADHLGFLVALGGYVALLVWLVLQAARRH